MPFLGLDALQWFVVLDLAVLAGSLSTAALLFRRLQRQAREERRVRRDPEPPTVRQD